MKESRQRVVGVRLRIVYSVVVLSSLITGFAIPSAASDDALAYAPSLLYANAGTQLYRVNTSDGSVAHVGSIGPDVAYVEGLSHMNGVLYATGRRTTPHSPTSDSLMMIDENTGAATPVGWTGYLEVQGMAVSPSGQIFGADSGACRCLIEINAGTGAGTQVGPSWSFSEIVGLDFDASGDLYGVEGVSVAGTDSKLIQIDPSNGSATLVGMIGFTGVQSIAFSSDGTLFGTTCCISSSLITIDASTGVGTLVATTLGFYGADTVASSVGGIAEQPNPAALQPIALPESGDHRMTYSLGGASALLVVAGAACWVAWRRRNLRRGA